MDAAYANPRAGNAGAAEVIALGRANDEADYNSPRLERQAFRIRQRILVSGELARAYASLAFSIPEQWGPK